MFLIINCADKFCYWHKQTQKFSINCTLTKAVAKNSSMKKQFQENIGNFPKANPRQSATFLKLHVDRQQIHKNFTSARMFPEIFQSALRGCHCLC